MGSCDLGSQIFEKKKIDNGFTMGVYPYLNTHDDACVLLIQFDLLK